MAPAPAGVKDRQARPILPAIASVAVRSSQCQDQRSASARDTCSQIENTDFGRKPEL